MTHAAPQQTEMGLLSAITRTVTMKLRGALPAWKEGQASSTCNHVVQFYAGPFPAQDVADFVKAGLEQGEGAVIIATPAHTKALRKRLQGHSVTYLDAEETLERFLVHGRPDRMRFMDTVGKVARDAAQAGNGNVRAFGEMVVLLCERGEPEAAAELESLWNELGQRQAMKLLCSYPSGVFTGRSRGHRDRLRGLHTHAVA